MFNFERHDETWRDRNRRFHNLKLTSLGVPDPDEDCGIQRRHFFHGAEPEPFGHYPD
jgi:hypothetical protein